MKTYTRRILGLALAATLGVTTVACDAFLDVTNPNSLEEDAIDPERDANLLGASVYQSFITDMTDIGVYVAWFTHSAWVGDTFPTRNEIGRRDIANNNSTYDNFWQERHDNIQFARATINAIEEAGPTLDLARSHFVAGYEIIFMADLFCQGTIAENTLTPRGPIPLAQLYDSAIAHLQSASQVGNAVTGSNAGEAQDLAMAAQVGIARAHQQAGRSAQAASVAAGVPDDFEFFLWHLDDASNRALGNGIWSFSFARQALVVPPYLRELADAGDPRVAYFDNGHVSQDGILWFYRQDKYQGYADFQLLASGLEAQYIALEAEGSDAEIRAFVDERRAVGGLGPMDAGASHDELMTELLRQKTLDFWLEDTKRMADFRRVPQHMTYVMEPGETYYKPETYDPVQDQTCWPVPNDEIDNNPGFDP